MIILKYVIVALSGTLFMKESYASVPMNTCKVKVQYDLIPSNLIHYPLPNLCETV